MNPLLLFGFVRRGTELNTIRRKYQLHYSNVISTNELKW